jgi:hypothetical protein
MSRRKNRHCDPSGSETQRPHQQKQLLFDWIDALLVFGGLAAYVLVLTVASNYFPWVADSIEALANAFAIAALLGPVLIRNRYFPDSRANMGVVKKGLRYSLMSILGLGLTGFGTLCSTLIVVVPAPESYEAFVERRSQQKDQDHGLRLMEQHRERRQTGTVDHTAKGKAARRAREQAKRRAGIEWEWTDGEARRHVVQAIQDKRTQKVTFAGLTALALAILLLRARFDRSGRPHEPGSR